MLLEERAGHEENSCRQVPERNRRVLRVQWAGHGEVVAGGSLHPLHNARRFEAGGVDYTQ